MPLYALLMTWSESQLAKTVPRRGDTTGDAFLALREELNNQLEKQNAALESFYWTLGPYDMHAIVDAPSEIVVAGVALYLGQTQGVRTMTTRAFDVDEMARGRQPADDIEALAPGELTVADANYRCHF
jgi:uncharacterized protein with GYD domain